jgi:protein-disulfide isomerase
MMRRLRRALGTVRVLCGLTLVAPMLAGCPAPAADPSTTSGEVNLPGIDTSGFTPREKHELARYAGEYMAPCPEVPVSIGQCVQEKRACSACVQAAEALAKAVREGLAADQVDQMYKQRFDAKTVKLIPVDGSPSRGPEDAKVTIVEFADFECPFCQRIAPTLDDFFEKHKGEVRMVYKFMPLPMHPRGEPAARAAIAAQQQGEFWAMDKVLFAAGGHLEDIDLDSYARQLGLDVNRLHADEASPQTKARIDADRQLADQLGVKGTPTLYVNGREFNLKGDLEEWVKGELAKAR